MAELGAGCAAPLSPSSQPGGAGMDALRALLHGTGGWELRVSRYLPGRPALERDTFSGGVNLSARSRNARLLDGALRVYRVASAPGVLFCSPWVYGLIKQEATRG